MLMARRATMLLGGHPRDSGAADFANNRLEWRRLIGEAGGTFLLVLVAAGAGVVDAVSHGQVGRTAAVTAPGLMVLALIYTIGATSGAHLNPAVTVAFAASRALGESCPRCGSGSRVSRPETETREDAYLLQPRLRKLAVKLRDGREVDLKALLSRPGPIDLPYGGRGTLELWRIARPGRSAGPCALPAGLADGQACKERGR
jgi:Major intrinsic protein